MGRALDWSRPLLASFLAGASSLVCTDARSTSDEPSSVELEVHTTQHRSLTSIGLDTLSDSARITHLLIDPADGRALVVMFADQLLGVSSGLAIIDQRSPVPQLVWPDSVTAAWWPASHQLAFTTQAGSGARVVIDVHAAELVVMDTLNEAPPPDTTPLPAPDSTVRHRAETYVDSVHAQTDGGLAPRSAFVYSVDTYRPSRRGTLLAFHVAARNTAGAMSNPAWFLIDRDASHVRAIDQVIGPANQLPEQAAAWADDTTFYYVKGRTLWKAEVRSAVRR